MSAVIALTAVPNFLLQYEKKAEVATTEISSADVTSKYNKYFSSSNKRLMFLYMIRQLLSVIPIQNTQAIKV